MRKYLLQCALRRKAGPFLRTLVTLGTAPLDSGWQHTTDELPVMMRQWAVCVKLHASIAIREGQELDTAALERKLNALKARIKSMTYKRSDGVAQPPVQNYRRFRRGSPWLG